MPDYEIVVLVGEQRGRRYPIPYEGLRVGRNPDMDVRLMSPKVSREHARIWMEKSVVMVEDLGSRNGITLHGKRVKRAELSLGEKVAVGDVLLEITNAASRQSGKLVVSQERADDVHQAILNEASGVRLPILYRATQLLGAVFDIDELFDKILGLIFEAVPVRRGYVVTMEPGRRKPIVHAQRSKERDSQGPPISYTMIRHVVKTKEAVLTLDAQEDSRFDETESVVDHGIHAAMCAPLRGRNALLGAIYVDSGTRPPVEPYTYDDLEMLTAIARVVGVAVENARLYQDQVQRERLAAIGEATAGIGHTIKNILTGMGGGVEMVKMGIDRQDFSLSEKGGPILGRAIERMEILVRNMLSYSRDRAPNRSETDLAAIVAEVLDGVRTRAEKFHVTVENTVPAPLFAYVDREAIFQVMQNLAFNAVEACDRAGGMVTITGEQNDSGCALHVSDTGEGIPEQVMPKLFHAFFSTKGSSGTGLGLASSQKIANEHGGTIEARNRSGGGAVFSLHLPAVPILDDDDDEATPEPETGKNGIFDNDDATDNDGTS